MRIALIRISFPEARLRKLFSLAEPLMKHIFAREPRRLMNNFFLTLYPSRLLNLASLKETHMHALKISPDSKDSITHTWTLYEKGERKSDVVIKLVRTKA
jgi:hypothetical protein